MRPYRVERIKRSGFGHEAFTVETIKVSIEILEPHFGRY